jgi:hypothetical protein
LSTTAAVEDAAGDTLIAAIPKGSTLSAFSAASGFGLVNVTGGAAGSYFDTNSFANAFDTTHGGKSDVSFTSDFSSGASGDFPISGSGTLKGNALAPVPEPTTIGLLGVGLLGLAAIRRRA